MKIAINYAERVNLNWHLAWPLETIFLR